MINDDVLNEVKKDSKKAMKENFDFLIRAAADRITLITFFDEKLVIILSSFLLITAD